MEWNGLSEECAPDLSSGHNGKDRSRVHVYYGPRESDREGEGEGEGEGEREREREREREGEREREREREKHRGLVHG